MSWIRKMLSRIKKIGAEKSVLRIPWYQVEEFNSKKKIIIFRLIGKSTVFKFSIEDAICNNTIIEGLSPIDASMLGLHAAQFIGSLAVEQRPMLNKLTEYRRGEYALEGQTRDREVIFRHIKSQTVICDRASNHLSRRNLVARLTPHQALYLGLLAGLENASRSNLIRPVRYAKPKLRLVKS